MTQTLTALSIAQLSTLIQSGALDPVTLMEATFEAISAADPAVFLALSKERALAEAQASSRRVRDGRSLGPLDGIPIAWKDLFDMAGMITTAGSKVLSREPAASRDAAIVAALKAAGMVAVGRLNMSEFAFSGLGINPHYGTPENPRSADVPRIPGGSSSGSAVAVASGLVPVAMGTDTGGSIRIPAAFNGIVGYKATRGRYPMDGVFPLAKSLDSLGPLCRSVQDAVWIDAAMRGLTTASIVRSPLAGVHVIIPENVVFDGAEPGVVTAFEGAVDRLVAAGVTVDRTAIPAFDAIFALMASHGALVTAEAYALHKQRLEGDDALAMDPRVVSRTRLGANIGLPAYIEIIDARARLIAEVDSLIGGSLVAFPTIPHVAPPIAPLTTDDALFVQTNAKTLRNTLLGNFLDWCGVSIPCGTGDAGMPVGFLLSGPARADETLLSVALSAEPVIRGDFC